MSPKPSFRNLFAKAASTAGASRRSMRGPSAGQEFVSLNGLKYWKASFSFERAYITIDTTSSANSAYIDGLRGGMRLEASHTTCGGGWLFSASIHGGTGPMSAISGWIPRELRYRIAFHAASKTGDE